MSIGLSTHSAPNSDLSKSRIESPKADSALREEESVSLYRNRYKNLQAQFREKDRIISLVSHHLRGPLASTQGISDLIQTYVENGECEKTMAVIQHLENSFRDLMKLTDHLLTWAASDSSDLKLKPEACDIEVPIAESISALNFPIHLNEIQVDFQIKDLGKILMDPRVLKTIIHYLLDNAVKFSPKGGKIEVVVDKKGPDIALTITNQGKGFSPELVKQPFQYHRDLIQKGNDGEVGLGLGLISAQNYLSRSGGLLKISNLETGGASIEALFPLAFTN